MTDRGKGTLLLRNVVLLDGSMVKARAADVAVEAGRITAIEEAGNLLASGEIFDGRGRTALLPGFVNAHSHSAMTLLRGLGEESPLMEWLQDRIWPVEARLDGDAAYWGTMLAALEMTSTGTTTFGDMYFFMDDVARAAEVSGMRCGLCRGLIGGDEAKLTEALALADDWHGREGRFSVQIGPHAPYTVDPATLTKLAALAKERDLGIHLHWLETAWERDYFRTELKREPLELLEETGLLEAPRLLLAHGVWIDEADFGALARDNVTVVHNPSSNMKLGSGIAPVTALMGAGVHVALGTDGAASNNRLDLWQEMRSASFLAKVSLCDPTVLTARQTLSMATVEGARALGFDDVGLIRRGWQADFTLVDLDRPHYTGWDRENLPLFLLYAGSSADVVATLVQGKWLYREGGFSCDAERIRSEALRCRRSLLG